MLLFLIREKSDFEIKVAKKCFPLFIENAISLARRGGGGGGGGGEAEARRGDGGAAAGARGGAAACKFSVFFF